MSKPYYIYVMKGAPHWPGRNRKFDSYWSFKVGISDNPHARLATFQTSAPFPISIFETWKMPSREAAFKIEQGFHRGHGDRKLWGEWFYDCIYGSSETLTCMIASYAYQECNFTGETLLDFVASTGIGREAAEDYILAECGEEALA